MKATNLLLGAALCASLTSCFKDEPLNAECDIERAYVHIDNPLSVFYALTDTLVSAPEDRASNEIVFNIRKGADVTAMAPVFQITEGAVITPASGSTHDFSNGGVAYTVTSQDGDYSRTYNVLFKAEGQPVRPGETTVEYDFEHYTLVNGNNGGSFYTWQEPDENGEDAGKWATGNPGFNIVMSTAKPEDYPTSPYTDGYDGACVKLETKTTGLMGKLSGMPIAAGNLFLGSFDAGNAMKQPLMATNFGMTFSRKPLRLSGMYKYKPGTKYTDKQGNEVQGQTDMGHIYAVFYRNHDAQGNAVMLHGDDVLTNPNIVAVATAGHVTETADWTEFSVDFEYTEDVDLALLAENGYNLAFVCTSSYEGASFRGAVGSTLFVDQVRIVCDEKSE